MSRLIRATQIVSPPITGVRRYHDDPCGFVRDCFVWPPGQGAADYQEYVMRRLVERMRVSARGPHGLGKTTIHAWLVLWFALTRDAAGEDWKVPTTASAWRQLEKILWPEIRTKWVKRLKWDVIGREPFNPKTELFNLELRLNHGLAFAAACEDPAKIEGVHGDEVLFVYDEAKAIPDATFDATEGAFAGGGDDTLQNAYGIASSTPGEPVGRFYDIHSRKEGYESWEAIHVSLEQVIRAGRVSKKFAEDRKRQWGENSQLYTNRVLGEFATAEEDGVIPLRWVEMAQERWLAMANAGWQDLEPLHAIGVDVATSGKDKTVFALRHGLCIHELRRYARQEPTETAGRVAELLRNGEHSIAMVDHADAGVIARLTEQGFPARPFISSHHDWTLKDMTGILEMHNQRAAGWWYLRDLLNPENGFEVALPEDDKLTGDLVTPKWEYHSSGRIKVESKDDIRKRLGRSPDDGDAVVYAFWSHREGVRTAAPMFASKPEESRWGALKPGILTI